jgi:hypothetical protein
MTPRSLAVSALLGSLLLVGCGQVHSYQGIAGTQPPTATTAAIGTPSSASPGVTCQGLSLDIAPGVKGTKTVAEAIAVFLKSGPGGLALPRTGWRGPASGGRFTTGAASVNAFRIPGAGFVVNEPSNC